MTVKGKLRDSNHVILLNSDKQSRDWEHFDFSKIRPFYVSTAESLLWMILLSLKLMDYLFQFQIH
jgi:hypothetical protein